MIRKVLLITLVFVSCTMVGQQKKYQFNGAARGYYFANDLDIDEALDTLTTRKANYGHTLVDLGVSLYPAKNTEIIAMFRIRNELGGFWGGGTSFNVRQLSLNGIAGGVVRYNLGDIDVKMTPYTLFNTQEEGIVNEADVFAIRRSIMHYDMFYMDDNTWRMQGGQVGFGLEFAQLIKEIQVKGFITRQRPTDGIAVPERLFGGGSLNIIQSKNLSVGLNSVNVFDLQETIPDSIQYKNSVHTAEVNLMFPIAEEIDLGVKSEAGMSSTQYINYSDTRAPEELNDWFYDAALVMEMDSKGLSVTLGYKDVGADFRSPGSQTKRINYEKFPALYQQFTNDAIGRPMSYADVISGNTENSFRISEELMSYNAAYNNTTPYGLATPNRRGVYFEALREDTALFRRSFIQVARLSQSRGTGTSEKMNFILAEAGTDVYLNDIIGWKKEIKIGLGVRYENSSRAGEEYETAKLNSTLIDLGLSVEFLTKLDLLLGAKLWNVSGNAFVNERNRYNTVENFDIVELDFVENTYAGGLRYRFNENNSVTAQYQLFEIAHADEQMADYGMSQFTFLLSLSF
ncbi:MAG: hypothetical protein ACI84C_001364 [Flavobacteriales bacterium]|jgi:hypothetical protein